MDLEILNKTDDEDNSIEEAVETQPDAEEEDTHQANAMDKKKMQESMHEADDLSDGISIISETESNGRLSPHPYLRDHLQDLNLKFATIPTQEEEDLITKLRDERVAQRPVIVPRAEQSLRQRPGRSVEETTNEDKDTDNDKNHDKAVQMASCKTVAELTTITPLVKRGLQGIFYVGVALALLSLLGRLRNPTWSANSPSSPELEQKLNDMELQNNLMRAEIDLLNKHVKYLSNLNDQQQQRRPDKYKGHYDQQPSHEGGKKFKAWSGNGDSLRPVEITKDDLRKPYKCPDGSFKEFAGMCVENKGNQPNIVDQFGQVVEDFKQQSETLQAFEKVAEDLHGLTENPFDQIQQILSEQQEPDMKLRQHLDKQANQFLKNKPVYQSNEQQPTEGQANDPLDLNKEPSEGEKAAEFDMSKSYWKSKGKRDNKYRAGAGSFEAKAFDKDFKKNSSPDNGKPFDDKQSKENYEKFKNEARSKYYSKHKDGEDDDDSKERYNKRDRKDSKEHDYNRKRGGEYNRNNNSKERYQKRDNNNNSKESRWNHKHSAEDDNSKERYNKRSKQPSNSKERFNQENSGSGEWQEHYMKHREELRKQNEQKYSGENKNWFMKRGDGREFKRNADIRYR
ncbi:uncharacterized protein DDB_G0283697 [Musca vetustissima]|uniref:uncharacterized protein DDB_G0283697 n=1 Tax=Musca vetustissima TaxID=27455 RepID=UPI002AB6D19B|nr:uncharacterized protein DDB_G0283697 [Musca vetustissima]